MVAEYWAPGFRHCLDPAARAGGNLRSSPPRPGENIVEPGFTIIGRLQPGPYGVRINALAKCKMARQYHAFLLHLEGRNNSI